MGGYSNGGALYNQGTARATGTTFSGNYALINGGAIFHFSGPSLLALTDCTITDNGAGEFGGGIYSDSGRTFVSNSLFTRNSAAEGGGIYGGGTASIYLQNGAKLTGNIATTSPTSIGHNMVVGCDMYYELPTPPGCERAEREHR